MYTEQSTKLISLTQPIDGQHPESLIAYCARVSSSNQNNPDYEGLLRYCIKHGHWSVFETVDMAVEIVTTRAIAPQFLRHRSFTFQEFSQRYAEATKFIKTHPREQDLKNRQNSTDTLSEATIAHWQTIEENTDLAAVVRYQHALDLGIAKEVARMILPLNTATKFYMKGNVRSWIHYFQSRQSDATQSEHRQIADQIRVIFNEQFPTIGALINE